MKLEPVDISLLIFTVVLTSSMLLLAITAAIRFGVRPLLADWVKLRSPPEGATLERRMAEVEEDIRQLKSASSLQLPAESVRAAGRPRT